MKLGEIKKRKPLVVTLPAAINQQKSKKALPNSSSVLQNGEEKIANQSVDTQTVLDTIGDIWLKHTPTLVKYKQLALDLSNVQRKPNDPEAMRKLYKISFALEHIAKTPEIREPDRIKLPKGESKSSNKKKKRPKAYEVTSNALSLNRFNPNNIGKLAEVQDKIDRASGVKDAYKVFITFAGNEGGSFKRKFDENLEPVFPLDNVDMDRFRAKLKNMCRMIYDYPELIGRIGDMEQLDHNNAGDGIMATSPSAGSTKAVLKYNTYVDRKGAEGEDFRQAYEYTNSILGNKTGLSSNLDYAGNHEMGHILNSMLFKYMSKGEANYDWKTMRTSGEIVKKVLKKVLKPKDFKNLKWKYRQVKTNSGKLVDVLDTKAMKLNALGLTSRYGEFDPNEFFAEAFSDVYAHGENARPASIELVKQYEKMRDEMEKKNKKRKGWLDDPFGIFKNIKKKKPTDDDYDLM